jgi:hypothetical protein
MSHASMLVRRRVAFGRAATLLAMLLTAGAAHAIAGATDHKPAASLLVPFFEVAIDPAVQSENTLLVVTNAYPAACTIHYHVWNVKGVPAFSGNVSLPSLGTVSFSLYDSIAAQSAGTKTLLTTGSFYRGFVTIDVVTSPTSLPPTAAAYPFSANNLLEGFIYYTRLAAGSANGLAMVPIEAVPTTIHGNLHGFYSGADFREEIDVDARACADGASPCEDANHTVSRIHTRVFGSTAINGKTRIVVFTWSPGSGKAGPSDYCATPGSGCTTVYPFKLYDEAGNLLANTSIGLPNVVNVLTLTPPVAGFASIWDVPSINNNMQVFAFSFNSAFPTSDPKLSWDAIFEGTIVP